MAFPSVVIVMKKGDVTIEYYAYLFIAFLIIGLLLVTVGRKILVGFAGELVQTDAALTAREISGIVNVLQTSPENTTVFYYLSKGNCSINLTDIFVESRVSFHGINRRGLSYFVENDCIKTISSYIECDPEKEKTIVLKRYGHCIYMYDKEYEQFIRFDKACKVPICERV